MEVRYSIGPNEVKRMTTEEIRKEFLISKVFKEDEVIMVYSHIDRMITGGACPVSSKLKLEAGKEIGAEFFLQRRELGIINVGGSGIISADGYKYILEQKDAIYVGMGAKEITFESSDEKTPAKFYFNSAPAHKTCPTVKVSIKEAVSRKLGSDTESNKRTIYQIIHPDVMQTCQLLMGLTILEPNNMWNTMPTHTHDRRMEVYFYFDMPEDAVAFHLIGEPHETRHIVIRNEQAVISPSYSIHSGVGTKNYSFIWGMVGENQFFDDMDAVPMSNLK